MLLERLIHGYEPWLGLPERRPQQPHRPSRELLSLHESGLAFPDRLQLEDVMTVGNAFGPGRFQPLEPLARHCPPHSWATLARAIKESPRCHARTPLTAAEKVRRTAQITGSDQVFLG
jgi:hypothetical protein